MDDMERRESHIELADKIARLEVCIVKGFAESTSQKEHTNHIIGELKADTERLIYSLYGNGQEGLITKVAKIHQRMSIISTIMWASGASALSVLGWFLIDFAQRSIM